MRQEESRMRRVSNVEDLVLWRDEVNEPLGLLPGPDPRRAGRIGPKIMPIAAPAVVAVAMVAFTFGQRAEPPRTEPLALRTEAPPAAPARAESPPSPGSAEANNPTLPPSAAVDRIEAKSGVKVTRQGGGASAPIPLIIDVQQALAAAKKPTPGVQR
jgi:hypothetical protein